MGPLSIQFVAAIALTSLYFGVALALCGIDSHNGLLIFIVPTAVTTCGGFFAYKMSDVLPVPWLRQGRIDSPPRRVHLSWRAAVRLPFWAPLLLFPWYVYWNLRMHFDLDWVATIAVILAAAALAIVAYRRSREFRLFRDGERAMAFIRSRISDLEGSYRILYEFAAGDGTVVSGAVWDAGYGVLEGSTVPVFYEAGNPKNHTVACASWFEAD